MGAYEATTIVAGGGNHDTQSNTAHLDSPSLNDVDIQYHADIVDEQAADDCWSPASSGCADVVVAFDSPATTTTTKTKTARSHLPVEMDAMLETKALRNIKCQQCRRVNNSLALIYRSLLNDNSNFSTFAPMPNSKPTSSSGTRPS